MRVLILVFVISLLLLLPAPEIDVAAVTASAAFGYVQAAMYFLPMGAVYGIGSLILVFWVFRVIVSLVKMIWDLLPFA